MKEAGEGGGGRCSLVLLVDIKNFTLTKIPNHLGNLVTGTRETEMENTAQCHCGIRLQSTVRLNRKFTSIPTRKLSARGVTHFFGNLYSTTDDRGF